MISLVQLLRTTVTDAMIFGQLTKYLRDYLEGKKRMSLVCCLFVCVYVFFFFQNPVMSWLLKSSSHFIVFQFSLK